MYREDLARIRHENQTVLVALRDGPMERAALAAKLGWGLFRLVLVLRRLERTGLL